MQYDVPDGLPANTGKDVHVWPAEMRKMQEIVKKQTEC
jgi:hypothetical protein